MTDINTYTCTGRLGADPQVARFQSGDPVVNLRVAVDCSYKPKDGAKVEKTLWLPVKITSKGLCTISEAYLRKGSRVGLSGVLESRSYEKDGQTHWVTELVLGPYNSQLTMLDGPRRDAGDDRTETASAGGGDLDDEIPF